MQYFASIRKLAVNPNTTHIRPGLAGFLFSLYACGVVSSDRPTTAKEGDCLAREERLEKSERRNECTKMKISLETKVL